MRTRASDTDSGVWLSNCSPATGHGVNVHRKEQIITVTCEQTSAAVQMDRRTGKLSYRRPVGAINSEKEAAIMAALKKYLEKIV